MKIPGNKEERDKFYLNLVEQCGVSKSRRREMYETRRRLYLWGSEQEVSRANKIESHIETQAAILYSGDTARFTIDLPTGVDPLVVKRTPAVKKKLNEIFRDAHLDVLFGQGVIWSLVYNSGLIKFVPRKNGFAAYFVEPGSFGVLREDLTTLNAQEAFTHEYFITRTELETRLADHPRKNEVLAKVTGDVKAPPKTDAGPIRAIATSVAYAGNITGYLDTMSLPDDYDPEVAPDMVRMTDLWVHDDDTRDYRTVLFAGESFVKFYDGTNLFLPQMHPFEHICPNPMYYYFWGESEVVRLRPLQDWRNERADQIRILLDLASNPPAAFSGFPAVDEKRFGTRIPGATITSQLPSAKIDVLRPDLPQDLFYEVHEIDAMFDDVSGINDIYQGKVGGSKTGGHAQTLGAFASLRPRKKALIIEDCLDAVVTKMLKVAQAYTTDQVVTEDGDAFTLAEYPSDVVVRTDGHSQSPVFSSQTHDIAMELFKSQAIDRESLIQLLNPPGVEELLLRLKTIEKNESDKAKQDLELEQQKILHGRR